MNINLKLLKKEVSKAEVFFYIKIKNKFYIGKSFKYDIQISLNDVVNIFAINKVYNYLPDILKYFANCP